MERKYYVKVRTRLFFYHQMGGSKTCSFFAINLKMTLLSFFQLRKCLSLLFKTFSLKNSEDFKEVLPKASHKLPLEM